MSTSTVGPYYLGLLAACTLFASVAWVDLDERLLIDASFVPSVLAMGFLGPAPAFDKPVRIEDEA